MLEHSFDQTLRLSCAVAAMVAAMVAPCPSLTVISALATAPRALGSCSSRLWAAGDDGHGGNVGGGAVDRYSIGIHGGAALSRCGCMLLVLLSSSFRIAAEQCRSAVQADLVPRIIASSTT